MAVVFKCNDTVERYAYRVRDDETSAAEYAGEVN